LINFERLEQDASALSAGFNSALPFPHVVIDDFLTIEGLAQLEPGSLMRRQTTSERSSDFLFSKNKAENPHFGSVSERFSRLRDELVSDRFQSFICQVVGREVFVDQDFVGGGLHLGGSGSYLDMHADFSRHPEKRH